MRGLIFGFDEKLPKLRRQIGLALVERADAEREPPVELQTFGLILPVDDIDDAGHARCVVRRGRIVDDLDALMLPAGMLSSPAWLPMPVRPGLLAVDEDRDAIAAAELDLPFLADRYAGQAAHRVEHGARRACDVLAEVEHAPIEIRLEDLPLRSDDDLVGHALGAREQQVAEVVVVVALADRASGASAGDVADEADAHGVVAALEALDDKPARLVGELAADRPHRREARSPLQTAPVCRSRRRRRAPRRSRLPAHRRTHR